MESHIDVLLFYICTQSINLFIQYKSLYCIYVMFLLEINKHYSKIVPVCRINCIQYLLYTAFYSLLLRLHKYVPAACFCSTNYNVAGTTSAHPGLVDQVEPIDSPRCLSPGFFAWTIRTDIVLRR